MRVPSAERKDQLIRATVELMRREGVQNLNLRAIADAAGASLATVHYCFEGKDDLLAHAVEYWLRRMVDLPGLDGAVMASGARGVAMRIADAFWAGFEDNPNDVLAQIELVTWAIRETPQEGLARRIYQSYEQTLGDVLTSAITASGETSTWSSSDLARVFIYLVDGACLQYLADPQAPQHKQRLERALTAILNDAISSSHDAVTVDRADSRR